MNIPEAKQLLLDDIVNQLKQVNGVEAIVLGGSYAIGMATETSDLDIGIFYKEENPFYINDIKLIAEKFSVKEQPTVTDFYQWGPCVNGGAWITTKNGEVDFIYKNIYQIVKVIENAKNGIWENSFEQQPPYGFSSIIFLAEIQCSKILFDPNKTVSTLKQSIEVYPKKLKQSVIQQSLWSAEFTIWQAEKFAKKADVYNTVGCLTRAAHNLVCTLFALNETYPLGDKRALEIIENFSIKPPSFTKEINQALCCSQHNLETTVKDLKNIFTKIISLTNKGYKPYYNL
jgi:predicted nucleotidyltransferase